MLNLFFRNEHPALPVLPALPLSSPLFPCYNFTDHSSGSQKRVLQPLQFPLKGFLIRITIWRDSMIIRAYTEQDLPEMIRIWNEIVEEGIAFPQEECLDPESGRAFFASQTHAGVAENDGLIVGLYILHPNNVGRCGHICNASYAVSSACRGLHIGGELVKDCMEQAKAAGFRILQFNAVVEINIHARHLYERLGFQQLGSIPGGFRMKDGHYENICPYYIEL